MSAYKGKNRRIKDALVAILSGITYDTGAGAEPAFVSVLDNTKDEFEGYPAVRVLPNTIASTTSSNSSKDHVVSFAVIMHFPLNSPSEIESDIYNRMYDLTDLIIDTTEHSDYIGKLSTIDPLIQNWMMDVTSVRWHIASGKSGSLLLCNMNIDISYSKDVY
ncbi:hypothetical protein [Cryobacterium sp. GrIS_2_6]|uniref:hypothetical protein n=1 Tax=Cryobacterium sp. GrIS_2_6 TaxID=3162785 RepID=UPI002DFEFC16|nr:hypothetical protein [Cryobacterium psychrotolerans]